MKKLLLIILSLFTSSSVFSFSKCQVVINDEFVEIDRGGIRKGSCTFPNPKNKRETQNSNSCNIHIKIADDLGLSIRFTKFNYNGESVIISNVDIITLMSEDDLRKHYYCSRPNPKVPILEGHERQRGWTVSDVAFFNQPSAILTEKKNMIDEDDDVKKFEGTVFHNFRSILGEKILSVSCK